MSRLNMTDLQVESFATDGLGGHDSLAPESGTHSLNYATECDCSGGVNCTKFCVEYSQATEYQVCCG